MYLLAFNKEEYFCFYKQFFVMNITKNVSNKYLIYQKLVLKLKNILVLVIIVKLTIYLILILNYIKIKKFINNLKLIKIIKLAIYLISNLN